MLEFCISVDKNQYLSIRDKIYSLSFNIAYTSFAVLFVFCISSNPLTYTGRKCRKPSIYQGLRTLYFVRKSVPLCSAKAFYASWRNFTMLSSGVFAADKCADQPFAESGDDAVRGEVGRVVQRSGGEDGVGAGG